MGDGDAAEEGGCRVPYDMVERVDRIAFGCDAIVQALECLKTAVRADVDGGLAFVEGTLGVLLLSAERTQEDAQALVEETARLRQICSRNAD